MENNMNMEFSMEGLDKLIKDAEEKQNLEKIKKEKMEKFTEIIQGVARKYASKWIDREDLEQDLWLRIMSLIKDCGGIENTDESLVARIAYNKAVDLYRYHRRRYDSKAEYIEGSNVEINTNYAGDHCFDNDAAGNYFEFLHSEKFLRGYDLVLIKEVIDLFEIGSRERKYAVLKLVNSGVLSLSDLDPWDRATFEIPETEDEEGYIHCLGYKSHAPGSWAWKKKQMKVKVIEFLS